MPRKTQRNRRRGPVNDSTARPAPAPAPGAERYEKYLPGWMKDGNAPAAMRAARVRRPRQQRAPGGYTPGKASLSGGDFR